MTASASVPRPQLNLISRLKKALGWQALTFGAILIMALLVRLLLLANANWMADYDEALMGLMAIDITEGARPIFLYGQPYLGALEPYMIAVVFWLAGASLVTLKIAPLLLSLVWVASTYLLARRLWSSQAALLAAALAALPPLYIAVHTVRAWGGTIETLILGNVLLLLAVNIVDASSPRRATVLTAILGLLVGFCFWLHWLMAYYIVAALVYIVLRRPRLLSKPGAWLALPAFFIGSLPLWLYNLQHDWATFRFLLGGERLTPATATKGAILGDLLTNLIPRTLGAESPVWSWLAFDGVQLIAVLLLLLFVYCVRRRWRGSPSSAEVVVIFVLLVPVVYLFSGFGATAINPHGIDAAGRYVVPFFSVAPLALAFLYQHHSRRLGLAALAFLLAMSLAGILGAEGSRVLQSPYYNRAPASYADVITELHEEGIRHVWTDIGLGQPLMFESKGQILTADYLDRQAGGLPRFPEAYAAVENAPRAAYLVAVLPEQSAPLEQQFQRLAIPYQKWQSDRLLLLIPERRVQPAAVAASLGYQY